MSKVRPSPRRGGRRGKQTPVDDSSNEHVTSSKAAQTKGKGSVGAGKAGKNTTPTVKKSGKPPRNSKPKKSNDTKNKVTTKGKKQLSSSKNVKTENDSGEEDEDNEQGTGESEGKVVRSGPKKKSVTKISSQTTESATVSSKDKGDDRDDEESDENTLKINEDADDRPDSPSVGEELMEYLSKGGKKKKAMRNCIHCSVQSPVSRAKKCPNCGKNLFNKTAGFSRDYTCPKCNHQQHYSGTLSTVHCSRCNILLTRKHRDDKDSSPCPENDDETETTKKAANSKDLSVGYGNNTTEQDSSSSCHVNSDASFQMGYCSQDSEVELNEKPNTNQEESLSSEIFGNETSQETLRRIIKRKILGEIESSEAGCPPSKKSCVEEEKVDEEKPPPQPSEEKTKTESKELSLSITSSLSSQPTSVSSPLMEYAQKISARLFIPPEISPQEVSRKGRSRVSNSKGSKSSAARNKRLNKEPTESIPPSAQDHSTTSVASQEGSYHDSLPPPPPLVRSDEPLNSSQQSHEDDVNSPSSTSAILPPLVSTKRFNDPTNNSIRQSSPNTMHTSSNKNKFYSSSTASQSPLVAPSSQRLSTEIETNKSAVHNGQVVSKNLYPECRTSSVPPLLSIGPDVSEDDVHSPHTVTHTTVIVDPRNTHDKTKDSSAPPALLTVAELSSQSEHETDSLSMKNSTAQECADPTDEIMDASHSCVTEDQVSSSLLKVKHSKRKQKLSLVNTLDENEDKIIYEVPKKKKKKKKKEKEKDRERSEKGHHEKGHHSKSSKGDKYKSDLERKARKKLKKEKKKDKEMEEAAAMFEGESMLGESQDDISSQCTVETESGSQKEEGPVLCSVKIKDCFIHQLKWGKYQMALLVPQQEKETTVAQVSTPEKAATPSETDTSSASGRRLRSSQKKRRDDEMVEDGDSINDPASPQSLTKKKKKQPVKSKIKVEKDIEPDPPSFADEQQDEQIEGESADMYGTVDPSSLPPSFSIYELRNKIFSGFPPRTVHAFTYKLRIRTHRPPLYWIHILKIIGGLPETCHMCRLLDVHSLKNLCAQHKVDFPECIDNLTGPNPNMEGRKLIDLSDRDPCSFLLNPEVLHSSLPHTTFQGPKHTPCQDSSMSGASDEVPPKRASRKRKNYDEDMEEDEQHCDEEMMDEREYQSNKPTKRKYNKRTAVVPLKLAKQVSPTKSNPASPDPDHLHSHKNSGTGKKKPCPNCGYSMLRKSKKCVNCGKPFGVFTFGRRQCTYCGHINLARMSACFRCGQSLEKAPTAVPKISEIFDGYSAHQEQPEHDSVPVVKHDFKFGVKRKRRVQSIPSPPLSSQGRHHRNDGVYESPDEVFNEECDIPSPLMFHDKKKKGDSHQPGYRYGKIPWNDADLALIVTASATPKLCLQEVCSKVLRFHQKNEVFELVKSLNLQLEPGDTGLLKKLQALGLHPNRSPLCRLIASEDLFALMDALEEPVPDEVHQYLGSNSTIEISESVLLSHTSSSSPTSNPPSGTSSKPVTFTVDDQEHGFESTLHEIECSDGQLLAMLRSWNGDHFLCLLEVWRRYFPEVNRSNLSAVIKRLEIETKIPTSQQTNLLRAAGIISVRGAPGRLIKVNDMQKVLDDFGIMLKIGDDTSNPNEKSVHGNNYPAYKGNHSVAINKQVFQPRKSTANSEVMELATCMSLLLDCAEQSAMESVILADEEKHIKQLQEIESSVQGQATHENILHNHILCRRELCSILTDEISFLTVCNHTTMAELVHTSYSVKQILGEIDSMIDYSELVKKTTNEI